MINWLVNKFVKKHEVQVEERRVIPPTEKLSHRIAAEIIACDRNEITELPDYSYSRKSNDPKPQGVSLKRNFGGHRLEIRVGKEIDGVDVRYTTGVTFKRLYFETHENKIMFDATQERIRIENQRERMDRDSLAQNGAVAAIAIMSKLHQ